MRSKLLVAAITVAVCAFVLVRVFASGGGGVGDRSEFSDASCVASDPAGGPSRPAVVVLDAGHGGLDEGTSGRTSTGARVVEKKVALATAMRLRALLLQRGYRVVMTRTEDTSVAAMGPGDVSGSTYTTAGDHRDIRARVDCANASGAAVMVSIHFNAFDDPSTGGAETYYDPDRSFAARNHRLAEDVQSSLMDSYRRQGWTAIPDRGVTADTNGAGGAISREASDYGHLYLLGPRAAGFNDHPSTMPGVLVEPLFLTDPPEADIAASSRGQRAIARGLAAGISRFLSG